VKYKLPPIFIFLFLTSTLWSQRTTLDSLKLKTYDELKYVIETTKLESIKKISATAFLNKAKKDDNLIKIAEGYNFSLSVYSHTLSGIKYADSIIQVSHKIKDTNFIANGYLNKGIQLYYSAEHKEALKNYLLAHELALDNNNLFLQLKIKHYIASLKNTIDEEKEALVMFKENLTFFNNADNIKRYRKQYLKSLFSLSNSYNINKIPDSSLVFIERGIKESLKSPEKYLYPFFVLSYGVTKQLKGEYEIAIDSLLKGASLLKNQKKELCDSYLLLSETYYLNGEKTKSTEYLKKIDSIYINDSRVISRAKKANELLAKYYQETGEVKLQLEKIKKIIKIDSVLKIKHESLGKKIIREYETPLLISEKERLISELVINNTSKKTSISVLVISTFIFLLLTFYFFRKNKVNNKRFNTLMQEFDSKKKLSSNKNTDLTEIITTELSEELANKILLKLENFEKKNKFTKKQYSLNDLAKELNTNSSYLSKIINSSKQVNFTNYLNKLRIEYAIERLKTDTLFRKYTVQSIAEETGFNKAQSFSTAFKKKTGISVTYFINQLKRN